MHDDDWDEAVDHLSDAAESLAILANCLAVTSSLTWWRAGGEINGMTAADALDQALGMLERLSDGEADALIELVKRILHELPVPLE